LRFPATPANAMELCGTPGMVGIPVSCASDARCWEPKISVSGAPPSKRIPPDMNLIQFLFQPLD
jgi:hypothetical protein